MAKVRHAVGGTLDGTVLAAWGLTFKARTDDRRDSPALEIIGRLLAGGARVQAFDPTVAGADARVSRPASRSCPDAYAACRGAAALVVLTEWEEFRWVDFSKVRDEMADAHVVDARNLLDPAALRRMGFSYVGIGRP